MQHYVESIRNYGTTDNYNMEYTERLHIDLTKDAYKLTNFKDEFTQMTLWLEWKEKVVQHAAFIKWRLSGKPVPLPPPARHPHIQMTKNPMKMVALAKIASDYTLGAEGVLPGRHIESLLRVFKQFTHALPSR